MSLRKFMHPRNKYKTPPKFEKLAAIYPEFRQHVVTDLSGKLRFNFKNEESLRILTKILLQHDFNLDVQVPLEKLVPALPLRLNYILWIEDLMKHARIQEIYGIDIGTGAICIYPLLCAKINGWKMIATEIDPSSVQSAVETVKHNNLDQLINVTLVKDEFLLREIMTEVETYSFTMCNPPFFNLDKSVEVEKNSSPRNAKTGNPTELAVNGGEFAFVNRMIHESVELKNKVIIYTCMLGLKINLLRCQAELSRRNIENSTWTEFCQGYTKRWGLAWSFCSKDQLNLTTAPVIRTKKYHSLKKKSRNNTSELVVPLTKNFPSITDVIIQLKNWIRELEIEIKELPLENKEFHVRTYELNANEDKWSHARRKRRMAVQREQNKFKKLCVTQPDVEKKTKTDCLVSSSIDIHKFHNEQPYLKFNLIIGNFNTNKDQIQSNDLNEEIKICMVYQSGCGGKNALETFKQYLINKFGIRNYIQQ